MFDSISLNHVHTDGIQTILTRCFYDQNGVEIKNLTLESGETTVLEIVNDVRLSKFVASNCLFDGVSIQDQRQHITITLENCIFRKPFYLSFHKSASCTISLKNCIGICTDSVIVIGSDKVKFVTDFSSSQFLKNFQLPYWVIRVFFILFVLYKKRKARDCIKFFYRILFHKI